jgi:hypothetical protein
MANDDSPNTLCASMHFTKIKKQQEWFVTYFMIALECSYPILETLYGTGFFKFPICLWASPNLVKKWKHEHIECCWIPDKDEIIETKMISRYKYGGRMGNGYVLPPSPVGYNYLWVDILSREERMILYVNDPPFYRMSLEDYVKYSKKLLPSITFQYVHIIDFEGENWDITIKD